MEWDAGQHSVASGPRISSPASKRLINPASVGTAALGCPASVARRIAKTCQPSPSRNELIRRSLECQLCAELDLPCPRRAIILADLRERIPEVGAGILRKV